MDIKKILLIIFFFTLPFQLGTFFFFDFSFIKAIRTDYLAPALYMTDCIAIVLTVFFWKELLNFFKQRSVLIALGLLLIPVVFATVPQIAFYRYVKIIEWLGIFAIMLSVGKAKHHMDFIKYILIGLCTATAIELVLSILQLANKHTLQGVFYWLGERNITVTMPDAAVANITGNLFLRPYGTFSHPNSLAGFYLLLYFFLFVWEPVKKFPKLRAVIMFMSMLLVFISFSKVAIGTFLLLNAGIFLQVVLKNKCRFCGLARVLVLLTVAVLFVLPQGDPYTVDKRITLVDDALKIIGNFPLFGVGLGNYLYSQAQFPNVYQGYFLQPVHNILLLFLAEAGIVVGGAVLFLLFRKASPFIGSKPFIFCFGVVLLTGMLDHYWLTLQQNFLLAAVVFGLLSGSVSTIITKK